MTGRRLERGRYQLPARLLPDDDRHQLWVEDGRLTATPVAAAEMLPGRFALPGLVDAHAHVTLVGPPVAPGDLASAREELRAQRELGVLLIRDVGSPGSLSLDLLPDPDDVELLVAGRWHAPAGRFYETLHDPVPPESLVESARREIGRGATWVKVVADWRTPELSYDPGVLRSLVDAVHAAGARVAVHTQWPVVADLVDAGVDSVEHGTFLDAATIDAMAARGVAWTPTLTAVTAPLPPETPPERMAFVEEARANVRAMLPVAAARGVPILAGTDLAGALSTEIVRLVEFGLAPVDALRSATTVARAFLGRPALHDGAPADVVTFDADPRDDPGVLSSPTAVLRSGMRVR